MNIKAFPVGTTNIFPLSNSTKGGQLLSEFNIRSRESVSTNPKVRYMIGHSYTHSADDFNLSVDPGSSTKIVISAGRALVNGHYVESLAPVVVDIAALNTLASQENQPTLSGKLYVGLRMFYSNYPTVAGAALTEDNDDYYLGLQVVVVDKAILPEDAPKETSTTHDDQFAVNMHLLLGTFYYRNGAITNLVPNPDKSRFLEASRIKNINEELDSGDYLRAPSNAKGFYVWSEDDWSESTNNLMIWDTTSGPEYPATLPVLTDGGKPVFQNEAQGQTGVKLRLCHKQLKGFKDSEGRYVYYPDVYITLPNANTTGTRSGVVTPTYTQYINNIKSRVDSFYSLSNGKMRGFLETFSDEDTLPEIQSGWAVGDYVIVGQDYTVSPGVDGRYPSTLYIVKNVSSKTYYETPVWITGGVPFATEASVGGFINAPEGAIGNGYVRMNEDGYLQVIDFDLLTMGVAATQLGQDREEGAGLDRESLQSILDEYVNDRTCYPNDYQKSNSETPYTIKLNLTLPTDGGNVVIRDIGSRYQSIFEVVFSGTPSEPCTVTFLNCDKLKISNVPSNVGLILQDVNLYYDSEVLDAAVSIAGLKLWYEKKNSDDPNLLVDGMTVTLLDSPQYVSNYSAWSSTDDPSCFYALRSLTFDNFGNVIGIGMLIGDNITSADEGTRICVQNATLPQSVGIQYPATRVTKDMKVTGSYVSGYWVGGDFRAKTTDASIRIIAGMNSSGTINLQAAFKTVVEDVGDITGASSGDTIDAWMVDKLNLFYGGVVG